VDIAQIKCAKVVTYWVFLFHVSNLNTFLHVTDQIKKITIHFLKDTLGGGKTTSCCIDLVWSSLLTCTQICFHFPAMVILFFSQTCRRAAYHYIKKIKRIKEIHTSALVYKHRSLKNTRWPTDTHTTRLWPNVPEAFDPCHTPHFCLISNLLHYSARIRSPPPQPSKDTYIPNFLCLQIYQMTNTTKEFKPFWCCLSSCCKTCRHQAIKGMFGCRPQAARPNIGRWLDANLPFGW